MELFEEKHNENFDSNKKLVSVKSDQMNSNTKTKRMEANWFTSSAYKEKVGIYSRFSNIFTRILKKIYEQFHIIYSKTLQNHENVDFPQEKSILSKIKRILLSSFSQISEILEVYDLKKSVLLQDVTGLNYKLISRLTVVCNLLEDFINENLKEENQEQLENENKVLNNWFTVYSHLFKQYINEINFNLRLFDPNTNITQKLKKSSKLAKILEMLMDELSEIFLKNSGQSLLILIQNYKIQEINDLASINERLAIEKIKSSSPLSAFDNFVFILKPQILPFVNLESDKEFICKAANKFKKISVLRFSEICDNNNKTTPTIDSPDFFHFQCQYKYLHFFKPFSKQLLLFDMNLLQKNINIDNGNYIKIPLNINFDLSYESKSVITPYGEIYLSAGKLNEKGLFYPDDSFYMLDYTKETLIELPKMPLAKKLHGIAYMMKNIFIIGGKTLERKCTGECERFEINSKKWKKIASLNEPVRYPSVTTFGDKY